jgi:hypothetical protein
MLGWQLAVAVLGHLAGTNIVDEPAVEDYKARARTLRADADPLARAVADGAVDWTARAPERLEPVAAALVAGAGELSYLDVTVNGELSPAIRSVVAQRVHRLGNDVLGVPVKLRRAPAAYHVSEQCQLDGPPGVVSLRFVARDSRGARRGDYPPRFLHAQAVATWQAMTARGRACTLIVVDRLDEIPAVLATVEEYTGDRAG